VTGGKACLVLGFLDFFFSDDIINNAIGESRRMIVVHKTLVNPARANK